MTGTSLSREECLRRAMEQEWLGENSRSVAGAAESFDRARHYRSLALVARPKAELEADRGADPAADRSPRAG